jgi:hypothetical protein
VALKDTNPNEEYPFIFMVAQSIHQRTIENASDQAYYTLSMVWKYYKIDENNKIVMDESRQHSYYDENFQLTAVSDYLSGDSTHANTLGTQQLSIKKIVEQETGVTLEVI